MDLICCNSGVKFAKSSLLDLINEYQVVDYLICCGSNVNPRDFNLSKSKPSVLINLDGQPYIFNGSQPKKTAFFEWVDTDKVIPVLYSSNDYKKVLLKIGSYLHPKRTFIMSGGIYKGETLVKILSREELKNFDSSDAKFILELMKYTDEVYFGKTKVVYF